MSFLLREHFIHFFQDWFKKLVQSPTFTSWNKTDLSTAIGSTRKPSNTVASLHQIFCGAMKVYTPVLLKTARCDLRSDSSAQITRGLHSSPGPWSTRCTEPVIYRSVSNTFECEFVKPSFFKVQRNLPFGCLWKANKIGKITKLMKKTPRTTSKYSSPFSTVVFFKIFRGFSRDFFKFIEIIFL